MFLQWFFVHPINDAHPCSLWQMADANGDQGYDITFSTDPTCTVDGSPCPESVTVTAVTPDGNMAKYQVSITGRD